MAEAWGELVRCGGNETSTSVLSRYLLRGDEVTFGRVLQKDSLHFNYSLAVPYLSASHFIIRRMLSSSEQATNQSSGGTSHSQEMYSYHLKSVGRNGTYVNGRVLVLNAETILSSGDRISIMFKGDAKLVFDFTLTVNKEVSLPLLQPIQSSDNVSAKAAATPVSSPSPQNYSLEKVIGNHVKKIESLEESLARLQKDYETLKENYEGLETAKQTQAMEILELGSTLAAVDARRKSSERMAAEQTALIASLRDQLTQQEASFQQASVHLRRIQQLEHELSVATQSIEAKEKSIREVEDALTEERVSTARFKHEIKALKNEMVSIRASQSLSTAANQALQDLNSQQEEDNAALSVNHCFAFLLPFFIEVNLNCVPRPGMRSWLRVYWPFRTRKGGGMRC